MQDIKTANNSFLFMVSIFIFWLVNCPLVRGQDNQKRFLAKQDYDLWSTLYSKQISSNGNWVSYVLHYQTEKDTLFVKSTAGQTTYHFPKADRGQFNGETKFACITLDTLHLQDLNSGVRIKIPGVHEFYFSGNHKYLVLFKKQSTGIYTLEIQDNNKTLERITDLEKWYFDPDFKVLVYNKNVLKNHSIGYIKLDEAIAKGTIMNNSSSPFQNFAYKGNTIAFIQNVPDNPLLFSYAVDKGRLQQFDPDKQKGFPSEMKISDELTHNLTLSNDGSRVFFWLKENANITQPIDPNAVEIWNTQDRLLFDYKKNIEDFSREDKMAVWSQKENTFLQITDKKLPVGFLNVNYKHAFIYDPAAYEPQYKSDGPIDLYIVDLQTGKRKCILEKYPLLMTPVGSPDGLHLCYAKDGHLWIYDVKKDTHTNITSGLNVSFFYKDLDMAEAPYPYGIGNWTRNGKSIIVYDAYDLWQINLDGSGKTRLTSGRENQRTYRINKASSGSYDIIGTSNKKTAGTSNGFLLEIKNKKSGSTGFCFWKPGIGITDEVWNNTKIDQLYKAEATNVYTYVEENYDKPPKLMVYQQSSKEIFQSNKQQQKFYWGKAELIQYTVKDKKMQGILYYPAGYTATAKYPMIVYIYERLSQLINEYKNPTLYSPEGFSINNYTAQGYFVLLPDMAFELGNVAESATKSVLAAVDTVLTKAAVDPVKIGLIGHSFGGYETDLIITQTDRFAAAISGAAWTDMVSAYLTISRGFKKSEYFRFEDQQIRIGNSLYDNPQSYLKNSPVLLAAAIKTPLLAWIGKEDPTIHPLQSMEMYMALRRLDKMHTLLVYPEEGHVLYKKENQKDLAERIQQWFDCYLKNGRIQPWMKSDN
jgi:dipeptidyl aminopeptidase/acylaminoacyl peptidase